MGSTQAHSSEPPAKDAFQPSSTVPFIPLAYDSENSEPSALRLVLHLRPDWQAPGSKVEFIRFTDGITNTLLKAVNRRTGLDDLEPDPAAILLRAYGRGTDVLIDRERETQNHELLARHGLAPELLARFQNGIIYRFVRGQVTRPDDLRRPPIYKAVARRLAEWHATVPCIPDQISFESYDHATATAAAARGVDMTSSLNVPHIPEMNGRKEMTEAACAEQKRPDGDDSTRQEAGRQDDVGGGHSYSDCDEADLSSDRDRRPTISHLLPPLLPSPNLWTTMQKWIKALPVKTKVERERKATLQKELTRLVGELRSRPGLGKNGLVFAHCDLLSGNVIVLEAADPAGAVGRAFSSPSTQTTRHHDAAVVNGGGHPHGQPADDIGSVTTSPPLITSTSTGASPSSETSADGTSTIAQPNGKNRHHHDNDDKVSVTFIDYEYAVPSPAAFDIANHFAEWAGFDCDFSVLPTRAQRRDFVLEYIRTYYRLLPPSSPSPSTLSPSALISHDETAQAQALLDEIELFRGVPGFYWGIWALIQATISQIDFDYASYAELRLGEYWAWRAEMDGSRAVAGREMPLRERRWMQE